ncbi:RNA polymerase sigma factor [Sphingomonas sp. AR_OL41]|uniref:RNA polymerase sigma factor n=1 Tax=Sphingomonas sp. AR_OL41 TaxID=3042729 RepID=UPI00247FF1F4|nr:RNA polymerase sigma factor [Sphingomonas sp. AR_OL41]MDH7972533.1 RNA polymerase sigma factor [Sphingomonas sp. AR_OL41]
MVTRNAPRIDGQEDLSAPLPEALPTTMELDVLYRNEQHALVRFFTRYRASPEDARDLVQEAFLRLSRINLRRSGSISRPAEYLRQIARNLLKDRAKAARRHAVDAHVNADDCGLVGVDELARLEARDSLMRLEAAIKSLKPKTREIFMAHHLEGLGYAEIAARTGLSVSGVEKQVARAFDHIDRLTGLH